jgi:hypothetical protein
MKQLFLFLFSLILCVDVSFAQHLKKDGTPDRRYKENRSGIAAGSAAGNYTSTYSTNYSTPHLKKDGTPDRRYTANRSTHSSGTSKNFVSTSTTRSSRVTYSYVKRNPNGKIARSETAKHEFMRQTGFSKGRPGYVVDHIIPLKKGGCDCASNMQWQTIAAAKAKDKWE